jgi:tRNA U34 5-methylaminomethyl-2-thiouridine-forming methyltransferase MnmC
MSDVKIIVTEDGSHSLYHKVLKETYHSFHGAINESNYVFIDKGIRYWRTKEGLPSSINIFEVGFGTGLNALLAAQFAEENRVNIHFHTIEPFPLDLEVVKDLNYASKINDGQYTELFNKIHEAAWEEKIEISEYFSIRKDKQRLQHIEDNFNNSFDVIFFDAFAPSKQAEMWEIALIEQCFNLLKDGGVFVTYSAKGQLKRDSKQVGFEVETLPGPPGKKEMVRATKNAST